MIIKKVKLENIRSFLDGQLEFREGVSLLSGDIGTGKSSVLLAIDFALFGLRRGEISGNTLLRNGCDSGYVELEFELDNRSIVIGRRLRKTATGISQESGFLEIDGVGEMLATTEMKQRVLALLNYPQDILSKKNIIYRYTVYTPQEEMKLILLGDEESRVETLRRVFNIDKYKRIRNNAKLVLSYIKEKRREFAGAIYDLEEKKTKMQAMKLRIKELANSVRELDADLAQIKSRIGERKIKLREIENEIKKISELKKDRDISALEMLNKEESLSSLKQQLININIEIKGLEFGAVENIDLDKIGIEIGAVLDEIKLLEGKHKAVNLKLGELRGRKKGSEELRNKIASLELCPMCEQKVCAEHKSAIALREGEKIKNAEQEITAFLSEESFASDSLRKFKIQLDELRGKQRDFEILKIRRAELESKRKMKDKILEDVNKVEGRIKDIAGTLESLDRQILLLKDINSVYDFFRGEFDALVEEERRAEVARSSVAKEFEVLQKESEGLEFEIIKKENMKKRLVQYGVVQDYIAKEFSVLMEEMEKAVMLRVHSDLGELFAVWFGALVDDNAMSVSLDDNFGPVVSQAGYLIDYVNLSGGEKTAAALAYRLALNQVINNMNVSVNTKNLLILDEPTDGFSSTQIDKMRFILESLDVKQVLIVSHESKIEGFCDSVIRFAKNDGATSVSQDL